MRRTILILALTLLAPASLAADDLGDLLARLEGGWYGENNRSPMGPTDFAMVWTRHEDGSWRSRSVQNRETWIELRFFEQDGRWMMRQAASLAGLGEQSSILEPMPADGSAMRSWIDPDRPEYLRVDLAVDDERLYMKTMVRGEEHATFNLRRTSAEEAQEMLAEFRKNEQVDPADQPLTAHGSETPQAIHDARGGVIAAPDSAPARVALAQALLEQIQAAPMTAPTYAGEMLEVLQQAVELDPEHAPAYQLLIGYYLNAPPIAGGSAAKARELADRLAEFAPEQAAPMIAMIEQRQE